MTTTCYTCNVAIFFLLNAPTCNKKDPLTFSIQISFQTYYDTLVYSLLAFSINMCNQCGLWFLHNRVESSIHRL